jgi:hypothetical protein
MTKERPAVQASPYFVVYLYIYTLHYRAQLAEVVPLLISQTNPLYVRLLTVAT